MPDAEVLKQISKLFEVPDSELLGADMDIDIDHQSNKDIALQLAILKERLANQSIRRRKLLKKSLIFVCSFFVMIVIGSWTYRLIVRSSDKLVIDTIECKLKGETYRYGVTYNQSHEIYSEGGDAWIEDHVLTGQYSDANMLFAQIEDYMTDRGETYKITRDRKIDDASVNQ